jgi:methionine-rich copper-binding protein CopC
VSHTCSRTAARVAVAAVVVATASLLLLAGAGPAAAHARLVRAVPGDGSTVQTAPSRVSLVFDEEMRPPSTIVVTGPAGVEVQRGTVAVADDTATVAVRVTAAGTYRVAFRVVSADGHPVTGETTFGFRSTPTSPAGASPAAAAGGHHRTQDTDPGFSSGRVVGIGAVAALLSGLGLLTVRRLPGGLVNPPRKGSP